MYYINKYDELLSRQKYIDTNGKIIIYYNVFCIKTPFEFDISDTKISYSTRDF